MIAALIACLAPREVACPVFSPDGPSVPELAVQALSPVEAARTCSLRSSTTRPSAPRCRAGRDCGRIAPTRSVRRQGLGTETAAAAVVLDRRADRPRRTTTAPAAGIPLALGQADHRRYPATPGCWHPADQTPLSLRSGRRNPRARGTPPTRRDSRASSNRPALKTAYAWSSALPCKIETYRV